MTSSGALEPSARRLLWGLFCASLAIRVVFLTLAVLADVPPIYDELSYVERAAAFRTVLGDFFAGRESTPGDLEAIYWRGTWPPLHPLLLMLGLPLGENLGPRLVVTLFSAASTPLVFLVSRRCTTRRGALLAAGTHALYPSFVAFAHLLWSETTFVFFLLASFLAFQRLAEHDTRSAAELGPDPAGGSLARGLRLALVAGGLLGLAGLTRAALWPYLAILPLFSALRLPRHRLLLPSVSVAAACALLAPWLLTLAHMEGRFVPLAAKGGYNLYLGNNPWVEDGHGSVVGDPNAKYAMKESYLAAAERLDLPADVAASRLALEHIREDPLRFLRRTGLRLQMMWNIDDTLLRHVFHAAYPPLGRALLWCVALLLFLSWLALVASMTWGFFAGGESLGQRALLLSLALGGTALPAVCFGMSRLNLPVLALLLPAAGHGLARLFPGAPHPTPSGAAGGRRRPLLATLVVVLLLGWSVTASLPELLERRVSPSTFYAAEVQALDRAFGTQTLFTDRVALRSQREETVELTVRLLGEDQWLRAGRDAPKRASGGIRLPPNGEEIAVEFLSASGELPAAIRLRSAEGHTRIDPVRRELWRKWQPSGLEGIEFRWEGGGRPAFD